MSEFSYKNPNNIGQLQNIFRQRTSGNLMNIETSNFFQPDRDKIPDTPQPLTVKSCFGQISNESRRNSLMAPGTDNKEPHFGKSNSSNSQKSSSMNKDALYDMIKKIET